MTVLKSHPSRRICLESSEGEGANISPPNCKKILVIFSSGHFPSCCFRISQKIP